MLDMRALSALIVSVITCIKSIGYSLWPESSTTAIVSLLFLDKPLIDQVIS